MYHSLGASEAHNKKIKAQKKLITPTMILVVLLIFKSSPLLDRSFVYLAALLSGTTRPRIRILTRQTWTIAQT